MKDIVIGTRGKVKGLDEFKAQRGAELGLRQNKGSFQVVKLRARDNMNDQGQVQRTGEGYRERTRGKGKGNGEGQWRGEK